MPDNNWTENTKWPRSDWQQDVANGDTQLGYAEWVEHNKESATQADITILNEIEDFITNNYVEPLSSSDKAEMFEHIVDLMDKRKVAK